MFKKIARIGLPLAVALGLTVPLLKTGVAQEQKTDETSKKKKRTEKSKRKGGGERRKAEQPKAQ
ncbi:MAG TPA: hypothetical protein VKT49_10725 [Bryobacteraceae bacterium]|nr:hypothetical protein [Bryobacteraceae bacterium]